MLCVCLHVWDALSQCSIIWLVCYGECNTQHYITLQSYYEQALERCKQEAIQDETYYNGLAVTTSYNIGRLHEALSEFETAENFYKIILKVCMSCVYNIPLI